MDYERDSMINTLQALIDAFSEDSRIDQEMFLLISGILLSLIDLIRDQ